MAFTDLFELTKKNDGPRIAAIIDDLFDTKNDVAKAMLERIWWRNVLYYIGEHWIEYLRSTKTFSRRLFPPGTETPVNNKVREFVRAQKGMLLNQKQVPKIRANTNERADMEAAELGAQVLSFLDSVYDYEIEDENEKTAIWLTLSGTTFQRTFPDKEAGAVFYGPEGEEMRTGEVVTEHVIPFNVQLDPVGDKLRLKRWAGVQSLKPREWVEDTFKVELTKDTTEVMDYQKRLMKLVSQVSPWKGDGIESSSLDTELEDVVIYREMELRPYKKAPGGRFIVTCQDHTLVDVMRMPILAEEGSWYYTLTDFHWNYVPGRFWSDGGVDDIISPQNNINEIKKALKENHKSIGRPRVITPVDLILKRLTEKGESFLALQYDAKTSGGVAPSFEPGIPYPQQILEEMKSEEMAIQDAGGDPKNILKGVPPSASASGIQVDILRETAEKGHYPDIDRWNRSRTRVAKKKLLLVKELFTEERLIKTTGRAGAYQVKPFKGADLRNNTDVRMELDSGISSTKAGQTQALKELADQGYLGDVVNDPEIRAEFLRRYGLSGFTGKDNVDIERAEAENSAMINGDFKSIMLVEIGPPDPMSMTGENTENIMVDDPLFKYDNHLLHYGTHRRYILGPEFKYLPEKTKTIFIAHTDIHRLRMQEEQQDQAQAMAEAAMAQRMPKETNKPKGAQVN